MEKISRQESNVVISGMSLFPGFTVIRTWSEECETRSNFGHALFWLSLSWKYVVPQFPVPSLMTPDISWPTGIRLLVGCKFRKTWVGQRRDGEGESADFKNKTNYHPYCVSFCTHDIRTSWLRHMCSVCANHSYQALREALQAHKLTTVPDVRLSLPVRIGKHLDG